MLRRGIPFGPAFGSGSDESERGLLFLAFQSSIRQQFEFLTQHWVNSALNPARGSDLLVGRSDDVRTMQIAGPSGKLDISTPELGWIVPTGGAYAFAPSKSGLAKFGARPAPIGLWKLQQLWAKASGFAAGVRSRLTRLATPLANIIRKGPRPPKRKPRRRTGCSVLRAAGRWTPRSCQANLSGDPRRRREANQAIHSRAQSNSISDRVCGTRRTLRGDFFNRLRETGTLIRSRHRRD